MVQYKRIDFQIKFKFNISIWKQFIYLSNNTNYPTADIVYCYNIVYNMASDEYVPV